MSVEIVRIDMQRQSGKTTLAVSMVKGAEQQGMPAVMIVPTFDWVRHVNLKYGLKQCIPEQQARTSRYMARLVVIDDFARFKDRQLLLDFLVARLSSFHGQTQIVIFE